MNNSEKGQKERVMRSLITQYSSFFCIFACEDPFICAIAMKANRILFVTQEINPYVPESPLTRLGREVPLKSIEAGREIRAFMPKWGNINERRNQLHEVIRLSGLNLTIDKVDHPLIIKVASLAGYRMQIYFIDSEDFFSRRLHERDAEGVEYRDNFERAVFYARSVLETVKKLRWSPDIIHCQGWISCLVPVYLRTAFADDMVLQNSRVVYSQSDNLLTLGTGPRAANLLEYRSTGAEAISEFGNELTPRQMDMLAIKYSDGVSFNSSTEPEELVQYARSKGKSIMKKGADALPSDYVEFFDYVWGKDRSEAN